MMETATQELEITKASSINLLVEMGVLGETWADFSQVSLGDGGYAQYERIGWLLGKSYDAVKWWIADWLIFGEGAFSDRCAQAAEQLGMSERTMQDLAWVGQNVPRSRRRGDLSFGHHRAVAKRKVKPEQQTELLEQAASQRMSSRDLDAHVRALPGETETPQWSDTVDADLMKRALDRKTVVAAAYSAVKQAQPRDGGWFVPNEQMARLRAAVGEE